MNQNEKNCVVFEINDLFIGFFRDNLEKFSNRMPSMVVDGSIQPYHACLPDHISSRIPQKNENPI